MSEIKVDTIIDAAGTGKPNFSNGVTINSAATSTLNLKQYTESSSEPSSPENGAIWWDTVNEKTFLYVAGEWKETIGIAAAAWYGERGLFVAGVSNNTIDYVTISTTGNATDFGDFINNGRTGASVSDATYGVTGGGISSNSNQENSIGYVTISTTGNAQDFGDLTNSRGAYIAAASNGTYGIWAGGTTAFTSGGSESNVIDYVTIATTGNAQDHGDLTVARRGHAGVGNGTVGIFGGGSIFNSTNYNVLDQVTISTSGDATDFGDLTVARYGVGACSDTTRGVWVGGSTGSAVNTMDYITMASTGNASDFGDLGSSDYYTSATSNATRGVIHLGVSSSNSIEYITIQTLGNATDFGDRTVSAWGSAPTSGNAS